MAIGIPSRSNSGGAGNEVASPRANRRDDLVRDRLLVRDDHIGGTFSKMNVIELPNVSPHVAKRRRGNPNWKKRTTAGGPWSSEGLAE
jgi:hypothetical protein